jgi:hypothetical protein
MTKGAADALCARCGSAKRRPWRKCARCGLDPALDEELLVQSVYLSVERFEDGGERQRYRKELGELAQRMRAGERPAFDQRELARLRKQRRLVASVPFSAVLGALFRLFLPAIVVIAILVAIILVRRW